MRYLNLQKKIIKNHPNIKKKEMQPRTQLLQMKKSGENQSQQTTSMKAILIKFIEFDLMIRTSSDYKISKSFLRIYYFPASLEPSTIKSHRLIAMRHSMSHTSKINLSNQ